MSLPAPKVNTGGTIEVAVLGPVRSWRWEAAAGAAGAGPAKAGSTDACGTEPPARDTCTGDPAVDANPSGAFRPAAGMGGASRTPVPPMPDAVGRGGVGEGGAGRTSALPVPNNAGRDGAGGARDMGAH